MPVKRSRAEKSSGHLGNAVSTPASAVCPVKVMKTDAAAAAEPSLPNILAVASAVSLGGSDQARIGEFLERCYYCNKRIAQNSEVFMYSNLCAFCSPECRDFQISLDCSKEKLSQGQGFYNIKGL